MYKICECCGKPKRPKFDASVSSPPFMESNVNIGAVGDTPGMRQQIHNSQPRPDSYGQTPGQLGSENSNNFWQAARAIVEQVYAVLKPGGAAAFVTGDFVRRGERVEFGRQWLELCEAVGFEPYAWAVAWKTEYKGTQLDIFGGEVERRVDRVSFFRRLANERNPEAAVLNEDVIIVRKPF